MKTIIALLAATTALGAIMVIPAIGAIGTAESGSPRAAFSASADTTQDGMVLLTSGDDEDDDEGDDEGDDCDDDGGDDEGDCSAGSNPAPAGTVAPPANGLFGNGAAPRVQVN